MAYYPKNKIQQNLQTNGGEYKTIFNYNNGIDSFYSGYYYKLYNGKTYTGKFPGDGNNIEIISPILASTPSPTTKPLITTDVPPLFPTPKDYEIGVFTRYFKKKRNEYLFDELTQDQYNNNVNNTLYIKLQIQWQLVGDKDITFNTNRNIVLLAEQRNKVPGLSTYLKENYLQYYKTPSQDNLYTNGKEFKTPDGREYIGFYHIHPDKGPMVGAIHTAMSHSILIPINNFLQPTTSSQMIPNISSNSSGGGSSY